MKGRRESVDRYLLVRYLARGSHGYSHPSPPQQSSPRPPSQTNDRSTFLSPVHRHYHHRLLSFPPRPMSHCHCRRHALQGTYGGPLIPHPLILPLAHPPYSPLPPRSTPASSPPLKTSFPFLPRHPRPCTRPPTQPWPGRPKSRSSRHGRAGSGLSWRRLGARTAV